jgi:hypothetical protein
MGVAFAMNPTISTWLAKAVGITITREAIKMPDLVRGKTRKVVQLAGEIDRQRHGHPPQTFTKYGLYGTDLGTPLDFGQGRELWFLFGDAWSATVKPVSDHLKIPFLEPALYRDSETLRHPYNRDHPFNADPVARAPAGVTAKNLDGTFQLNFFAATRPGQSQEYATLEIPGVNLLTNQVPTGAISTPTGVYVFATGKPFHEGDDPEKEVPQRSWVARWSDLTSLRIEPAYLFSEGRFANYLVPVVGGVNDGTRTPGHPEKGAVVWLWGTGFPNRQSSIRLAYAPLQEVGNRAAWRFFHRTNGAISWVTQESRATPLFNCPCVGEFSVAWNKYLGLWLMLYACSDPRGILCRWAANPWVLGLKESSCSTPGRTMAITISCTSPTQDQSQAILIQIPMASVILDVRKTPVVSMLRLSFRDTLWDRAELRKSGTRCRHGTLIRWSSWNLNFGYGAKGFSRSCHEYSRTPSHGC